MAFEVWPAIDLIKGRVVRLYKGSFQQKTEYARSPVAQARVFEAEGATGIHVIDLDGARVGSPQNLKTLAQLCAAVQIPVEVGGGIRTREAAREILGLGVARLIVSTAVIEQPDFLADLLKQFGAERVVVGVDARELGSKVATRGWLRKTALGTLDFAQLVEAKGVRRIIFTDIARDGTLTFPNFEMAERLRKKTNLEVIVAGGVSKVEHGRILQQLGCAGVVLGKALYEGEVTVEELVVGC